MNSQEVISLYETISDITGQMLAAARTGDWQRLTELESRCTGHVDTLKREEPHMALPNIERERKVRIIKKILENDREIRTITEPAPKEPPPPEKQITSEPFITSTTIAGT